jgi:hypothetical protein
MKRYTGKYSFNTRKQSYRKKHRPGGLDAFSGSFIGRLAEVFKADLMRSVAILVAAVVVVAAVLVAVIAGPAAPVSANAANLPAPSNETPAEQTPGGDEVVIDAAASIPPEDYNAVSTDEIDDATLAGLTGEDGGVDDASGGDLSEEELKGAIGVVFDNVNTPEETAALQNIEEASAPARKDGKIGTVKFYNSKGDLNQQLQDMRSMVNINAKAVILAVSDKETFTMMAKMAKNAGIPVVAINAPVEEGYDVNIVSDPSGWGQQTADFLKQKLLSGNYISVADPKAEDLEKQRISKLETALSSNPSVKSAASLTPSNKLGTIKTALKSYLNTGTPADAVIAGQGMGKNVLNACLSYGAVPKIFIGDATAGCIKLWYQLKTNGVEIEKAVSDTGASKPAKSAAPKTEKVTLKAAAGEAFAAESMPYGIGGTAFQFALRLSEGKKLKSTVDTTYKYATTYLITGDNIDQYYAAVKDKADSYVLSDWITDADADAMFE